MKLAESKGVSAILKNLGAIRNDVRRGVLLREAEKNLDRAEETGEVVDWLRSKVNLPPQRHRQGRVDFVVLPILREHGIDDIRSVPEILSEIGVLIDSDAVLAAEQVVQHYRKLSDGSSSCSIDYQISAGYRPHIDLIKQLPRCYYEHPSYLAPIEDLFDSMAIRFYAGKRASDAEDGAIGWLIDHTHERVPGNSIDDLLKKLSVGLKHWDSSRLKEAHFIWKEKVRPALIP